MGAQNLNQIKSNLWIHRLRCLIQSYCHNRFVFSLWSRFCQCTIMKILYRRDIYESSKYLITCLSLLGMAPYKINSKTRKFDVNLLGYLMFFVGLTIWCYFAWIQVDNFNIDPYSSGVQSEILDNMWRYQYLIQYFLAFLTVAFNFRRRNNYENFLNSIHRFDACFDRQNFEFRFANVSSVPVLVLFVFTAVLTGAIMCIVTVTLDSYGGHFLSYALSVVSYMAFTNIFLMISVQFIFNTFCVYTRLEALNKNFKRYETVV